MAHAGQRANKVSEIRTGATRYRDQAPATVASHMTTVKDLVTPFDISIRPIRSDPLTKRSRGWTYAIASVAAFMVNLDILVVFTALPSMRSDLHASIENLQWVISAYTLTFAVFLLMGAALGPLVGGAVISGESWQFIFWLTIPIGVAVLSLLPRVPESFGPAGRLDLRGVLLGSIGLLGIVLGLIDSDAAGWTSPRVVGPIAGGAITLTLLAVHELRCEHPMLLPQLFRSRTFSAAMRRRRYLRYVARLTPAQLEYLTTLDHRDHEALVAVCST